MITRCAGFSLSAAAGSSAAEPIRNSPAGIFTNRIPMEFVTISGDSSFRAAVGRPSPAGSPALRETTASKAIKSAHAARRDEEKECTNLVIQVDIGEFLRGKFAVWQGGFCLCPAIRSGAEHFDAFPEITSQYIALRQRQQCIPARV